MTLYRLKLIALVLASSVLLANCASKDVQEPIESTEQAYYQNAKQALKAGSYTRAVEMLEELESRYPFGRYAEQAQLDLIYAHYKILDYEASRAAADRFLRLHPGHRQTDYVIYLRGLASFDRDRGIFDRFAPNDISKRDPSSSNEAIADFSLLLTRFPDSEYADDARSRMLYLRNVLAAHEIHVARYYLKRQAYVAAASRGRYVVENFQQTPSVADGLAVMVAAYQKLELDDLAEKTLNVLTLNYPDYPALRRDGDFDINRSAVGSRRSILNVVTFGLLGKSSDQL